MSCHIRRTRSLNVLEKKAKARLNNPASPQTTVMEAKATTDNRTWRGARNLPGRS